MGFPYLPKHNALIAGFAIGLPTLALALWSRPGQRQSTSMLRTIAHFVLPAGISITLVGIIVYFLAFYLGINELVDLEITPTAIASFEEYAGIDYDIANAAQYTQEVAHLTAQTALTVFTTWASLILVMFVEPPTQFFVGGDAYSGDKRPTILAILLFLAFSSIFIIEPVRSFFELIALPWWAFVLLGLITFIWILVLRIAWRGRWLQRFLGVEFEPPVTNLPYSRTEK